MTGLSRRILFSFFGFALILPAQVVALKGHVHALANAHNDRGAVEPSFAMHGMTLMLKASDRQKADLAQLLAAQRDPASPHFHQWLTPEQYADRFGVSAADMAKISDWLKSQGFTVTNTARGRTWITFDGTAAQAEKAFHTEIHRYAVKGETHYANSTDPAIPASLAGVVAGFRGLNDFRLKPRLKRAHADFTQGGQNYLAPDDFATIYDVTPLYNAGVDGSGQSIMVVGQTAIRTSDISSFRSRFNLSAPLLQQVRVPGLPNPGIVQGDIDEANLDIEWTGAVARNATIIFVYSNDVWQSAMYAVDQALAPILSMSYGQCEQMDLVDLPSQQAMVQQANAEGITWFGPAGDTGAADCEDMSAALAQNGLAVDVPASIPEVTAMAGTEFMEQGGRYWGSTNSAGGGSALSYIPEMAWNDTNTVGGLSGTGGGTSVYFPRPVWQTGPGVPNDSFRHVPDLAMAASDNHDPYYFYSEGSVGFVGGTSAAVPTMAGIFALLNHYLVSTGIQSQPGLGNINPMLYQMAQTTTGVFHDVVTGDNIVPCATGTPDCGNGSLGLSAGPAYDLVSGWGSVDAANLIHQWSSNPVSASAVVPSIDRNPVFQQAQADGNGNLWSFHLTLTEEAGIPTTLTDFTVNGTSMAAQIPSLFGGVSIAAGGSISAAYGFASLNAPMTVVFGFTGIDASGQQWSTQLTVPFNGVQVPLAMVSMTNAASGQAVLAPGMQVIVSGTQLANFQQSSATLPLPNYLAGFSANINGVPVPLFSVGPNQVTIQIPYETPTGRATLDLFNPLQQISYPIQVVPAAPGIFVTPDGHLSTTQSGTVGQTVTLFETGDGQVRPALATGNTPSPGTPTARLPKPQLPVSVTVGGVNAQATIVGIPSGMVGVTRIDFTIPSVASGDQPVVVTVGGVASPPAVITVE